MTKHHTHCKHAEVAYCGDCQVVYCKSCKREWSDCKLSHGGYVYSSPPSVYPYTCGICDCTPCMCGANITWATTDAFHNVTPTGTVSHHHTDGSLHDGWHTPACSHA